MFLPINRAARGTLCFQTSAALKPTRPERHALCSRSRIAMTIETTMRPSPLLQRIREVSAAAQKLGTLKSIDTTSTMLTSPDSPPFLVRVLQNLVRKDAATAAQGNNPTGSQPSASASGAPGKPPGFNPFLPYEASMYVQHAGPRHVVLLNKFNVVADHVLIVTESFEEQNSLLNEGDFAALGECLGEVDGLAFYNSGRTAGASQRHKHLQLICGAVGDMPEGMGLAPFDRMLSEAAGRAGKDEVFTVDGLGFVHAAVRTDEVGVETRHNGREWAKRYEELLESVKRKTKLEEEEEGFAYNLVASRQWMMVVPRKEECFDGVSVNSLGFVGCLLVRTEEQMETVKRVGGLAVLRHTGFEDAE